MSSESTPDRELFEAFAADRRLLSVRNLRQQHTEPMRFLRGQVNCFREGERELTPAGVTVLRESVLRMLQLQHSMIEACATIPAEYSAVKTRILADFDTQQPVVYLTQVNEWLRLVEGVPLVSP
ncbi:hypothetical protein ACYZTX_29855 [Pseudomonas sp. MDT1-17]